MKKGLFTYQSGIITLMALTFGCLFFDRLALSFMMPFVAKDLQLSNTQIGLLAGALSLAWALSSYFFTAWTEANNRKKTVYVISVILFSLCSFGSGLVTSFLMLFLVRFLMGFSEGVVIPLSQDFVVKESTPERVGLNTGILQAVGTGLFGSILAPILLVPLAENIGWRNAFYIAGTPGLIIGLIAWFYIRPSTAESSVESQTEGLTIAQMLQYRNIRYCMILVACVFGSWFSLLPFITQYFVNIQGMTTDTMGKTMGLLGVSSLFSGFIVPALSDKYGRKPILYFFLFMGVLHPFTVHFLQGSIFHIPAMFVTYFSMGCIPIAAALIPSETVPEHSKARAIGLMVGVGEIFGGVLIPALAGVASDKIDPTAFLWVSSIVATIGLFASFGLTETAPSQVVKHIAT
jgi:predicted MFS family arabinose efflux permease